MIIDLDEPFVKREHENFYVLQDEAMGMMQSGYVCMIDVNVDEDRETFILSVFDRKK